MAPGRPSRHMVSARGRQFKIGTTASNLPILSARLTSTCNIRTCAGVPTDYLDFEYIASYLRPKAPNEVLLDYGCGLGRVILLASRFPFKKIIGIELAPSLVERAERNIQSFSGQRSCNDIQVIP